MPVRRALVAATFLLVLTLAVADLAAPGLPGLGWAGGAACWLILAAWVASAAPAPELGPADLVTVGRGAMGCGAAGLVLVSAAGGGGPHPVLFPLAVLVLVLDAVDGRVARRTGTASAFGGRLDGEVDAFVMLVLSVQVALLVGWWVLALGLLRYVFGAAGAAWSWLRQPLPFRWWRKVVTAVAGAALVAPLPGVLAPLAASVVLLVALALLLESFGRDVLWLWRRRPTGPRLVPVGPGS